MDLVQKIQHQGIHTICCYGTGRAVFYCMARQAAHMMLSLSVQTEACLSEPLNINLFKRSFQATVKFDS